MKRKESNEPDLFVVNKKLSEKERKEISEFIKQAKRKRELKNKKPRKAA